MGTHDLRLRLAQIAEHESRPDEAASLFAQVLRGNPYLVEAWWGLSQTVCDPDRALYCLKRVLALAPCHVEAKRQLDQLALDVMSENLLPDDANPTVAPEYDKPTFNWLKWP